MTGVHRELHVHSRRAFSYIEGDWTTVCTSPNEMSPRHSSAVPDTPDKRLSIFTWNVWSSSFRFKSRCDAIFSIIGQSNADVICLQEVTRQFLGLLKREEWVRNGYTLSDIHGDSFNTYGLVILCKFHVTEFLLHEFMGSNQERRLLYFTLPVHGVPITIATTHLESLEQNQKQRTYQIETSCSVLKEFPHKILCGDFNFGDKSPEEFCIKSWEDSWMAQCQNSEEDSFTMPDFKVFPAWRPDRILFSSESLQLVSMTRCGMEDMPLEEEYEMLDQSGDLPLTPSDHYGLLAHFRIISKQ